MSTPKENSDAVTPPVAVVGISALFPGSKDARGFWQDIMQGRDQIREVPPEHWLIEDYYDPDPTVPDKTYGKRGAFLSPTPFDAMAYGVPPNVVQQTDTSQLLGLIVAQQVLEDAAGGDFAHLDKSRISVILGATGTTELVVHLGSRLQRPIWLNALRQNGIPEDEAQAICDRIANSYVPWTEASFPGLLGNVIAGRIANKFDLGGTNCVVDAACASSLSALAMGLSELYMRQSDMVIVGGVDTLNDILMYMCFSKTPALSPSGDCRPFSDKADGTILGEGLGMLALRRLEDAEADGDRIYAVIRGLGSSSDGKGTAVYAPKASGQAHALRRAYAVAGYSPRTVELLEAHGTATRAGDAAEFEGASGVFGEAAQASGDESKQWCAIGSVKSQIGHTKGAAGAASLIKAVLALHHKVLPPTIKVDQPNPKLHVEESPFYINTQARPWVRDSAHPRRAGVSSFGFGGSNFHVTLEEYTGSRGRKDTFRSAPAELFVLGAATAEALAAAAGTLTTGYESAPAMAATGDFPFLARETQRQFTAAEPFRLAVVAKDFADLRSKLEAAAGSIRHDPQTAQRSPAGWYYSGADAAGAAGPNALPGKIAFLFPGQGSQYVGMGGDLATAFPESQAIWDHAAELEFEQGGRLQDVVFPHPVFSDDARRAQEEQLRSTDWAQPAIGVASLSVLAVLQRLGLKPHVAGGHSFGEVTALHAAGALDQKSFLHVARKRGELMAEAAAMFPGAMTAISHPAAQVAELIQTWNTGVVLANHNSPDQVVISGIEAAVEATEERLRAAGIRHQRLPVATAFHSAVVRPATAPFHAFLNHIPMHPPELPVYGNSTAAVYSNVADAMRETLADQLALPVLFSEQIEAMYAAGVRVFVEVGPGAVLTNLVKACLGERPHLAVATDRKGEHGLTSLWGALAQLAAAGVTLNLGALWEGVSVGADPRARKTPKLAVPISGVNYGKPYPPAQGVAGKAQPNEQQKPLINHATPVPVSSPARKELQSTLVNGFAHAPEPAPVNGPVNGPSSGRPANGPALAGGYTSTNGQSNNQPPAYKPMNNPSNALSSQNTPQSHLPSATPSAYLSEQPAAGGNGQPPPAAFPPAPQAAPVAHQPPVVVQPLMPGGVQAPQGVRGAQMGGSEALLWAGVFQELQRQTADAHMAFLQVAEQSMRSLEAMLTLGVTGGQPAPTVTQTYTPPNYVPSTAAPVAAPAPMPALPPAPAPVPAPAAASVAAAPMPVPSPAPMALPPAHAPGVLPQAPVLAPTTVMPSVPSARPAPPAPAPVPARVVSPVVASVAAPVSAPPAPVVAPAASAPGADLHGIMMEVVTEKTGYPTEMLEPQMALDTDLGIDSIKRVEILAAMRERVPALPEFDTSIMAGLRTLGEIVAYMDSQLGAPAAPAAQMTPLAAPPVVAPPAPVAAPVSAPPAPVVAPAASAPGADLHGIMMEVVTEKTGYPTEMLEPQMALDTDLGIDSIKRVEILAAMRERVPALPEFDTSIMAGLRTLGEIVAYMDSQLGAPAAPAAQMTPLAAPPVVAPPAPVAAPVSAPPAPVVAPAASAPGADLHGIMMEVVTEKTGYPTEMLEPQMALDTDLGIDSIKRVEILAAMRERVPALPEFDTSIMAGLRTLGEIVAYMDSQLAPRANGVAPTMGAAVGHAAAATDPPAADELDPTQDLIRRYTLETVAHPLPGLTPPFLIDGTPVFITDDGRGIAPLLAARLQAAGAQVEVCREAPPHAQAVICLAGLVAVDSANAAVANATATDVAWAANGAAFAAATAVAATMEAQGGLFVTVQDTGGDFGLQSDPGARAWLGGLAGLAKTAAQEWPQAVVRAIDLASALPPETVAARLAQELLQGGAELEIGLPLDGRRLGLLSVDTPAVPGAPVVNERSVLVVAGGGRGVTAAALVALAQAAHPHIALLGRTVLEPEPQALAGIHDDAGLKKALLASAQAAGKRLTPKELGAAADRIQAMREIRGTLLALSAAGAQAMYLACDVNDPEATAAALETVRGLWGPITGFVHGAGVLADKRLAEKTPEDFRRVFGAKVDGLRSLLAATAADPLRVICLFSSVAGRTGNAGQADYAMANEVLNRVAQAEAKRRPECVVKSIGWGPWAGGMVTPVLKAKFDELGVPLIPLASGARAFVAELQAPRDQVEVVIGGMPQSRPLLQTGSPDVTAATQRGVAQANRPFVYDVAVSAATHPYLYDHQVNGVVVLPLVLVQEWFLRAAEACLATALPCIVLDKMRVRKGVPLPEFGEYPVRLRVRCEPLPAQQGMWALTLHDAAGVVRFAAEAGVAERAAAGAFMAETISTDMAAAPVMRAGQSLYGRELFHGPAFAAIQSVEEVGELGAAGLIAGASDLHWGQAAAVGAAPWRSDLPLLDGALQLARVWGYTVLQRPTLPTAYARLSVRREGLLAGPLRCVVRGKPIGQAGTRSDLFLLDPRSGELLAEIRGLEMYVSSEAPLPEGER